MLKSARTWNTSPARKIAGGYPIGILAQDMDIVANLFRNRADGDPRRAIDLYRPVGDAESHNIGAVGFELGVQHHAIIHRHIGSDHGRFSLDHLASS